MPKRNRDLKALNGFVDLPSVRIQGWTLYGHFSVTSPLAYTTVGIGKGRAHTRSLRRVLEEVAFNYNGDDGAATTAAVAALWNTIDEVRGFAESFFDGRGRFIGKIEENPDGGVCVRYAKKTPGRPQAESTVLWRDVRARIARSGERKFSAEDRESLIKMLRELKKLPRAVST